MTFGFKEWALVCEALGSGQQSILIRKGGIAEGRAGFRFEHESFLLMPTAFHEQTERLKLPASTPIPAAREDGQCEARLFAKVEWTREIEDLSLVQKIAPFHIWQDSEIEKRFYYTDQRASTDPGNVITRPGVSIAFIRVEKLSPAFLFPDSPKYGGCRSWISLPDLPAATTRSPVLDSKTHAARAAELRAILS